MSLSGSAVSADGRVLAGQTEAGVNYALWFAEGSASGGDSAGDNADLVATSQVSAPLDLEPGNYPVISCPYCHSAVIVPESLRTAGDGLPDAQAAFSGLGGLDDSLAGLLQPANLRRLSEIGDLIIELRSATAGVATYRANFDHMAELTGRLADEAMNASGKAA